MQPAPPSRPVLNRYRPMLPAIYWTITAIGPHGLCGSTGTVPRVTSSYWAVDGTPYARETNLAYRYSPAFLWVIAPLRALRFEWILVTWTAAHFAALICLRAGWFCIVPGLNEDELRENTITFVALFAVLHWKPAASLDP